MQTVSKIDYLHEMPKPILWGKIYIHVYKNIFKMSSAGGFTKHAKCKFYGIHPQRRSFVSYQSSIIL